LFDDGIGLDSEASHAGFGLTSMRERVSLAGGELKITSGAGGTTIAASFPVKRADAGRAALRLATERNAG
jgi:signal transduction histidine kinase